MWRSSHPVEFLIVLCGMSSLVLSACFKGSLKKDGDEQYCEYGKIKSYPGDEFVTPDCNKCTCSAHGLSCCGCGKALLGVMWSPPWCKTEVSGCDVKTICQRPPSGIRKEWMTTCSNKQNTKNIL